MPYPKIQNPELQATFNGFMQASIREHFAMKALSDYEGETWTYGQIATEIAMLQEGFKAMGIKQGDKIALIGKNSANWCKIYLASVTYGAVIVPILPDFRPADMHAIVNHSDSVLLFAEESIYNTLDLKEIPAIPVALRVRDFSILGATDQNEAGRFEQAISQFKTTHPEGIKPEDVIYRDQTPDELIVISYTSGTTGFSKGVMLPQRSLRDNIIFARTYMFMNPGERILSFLPLAHAFGCAFEFLFPFTLGCHITFLTKTPAPSTITEAFGKVKPNLILSVPLVIEKIYNGKLRPVISKPLMKILLNIPGIRRVLLNIIKAKLTATLGGEFREVVIGGAAFNPDAEKFFRKMRFPFTVGYGMTECGPLMSYRGWKTTVLQGCGKIVDELTLKIDSPDPENISGEIMVKGSHVMLGYYKNPEATKAIIDDDGWLHSGDIGTVDSNGNIFIRGRMKSMILSASGQNIYPEEIEAVLAKYRLFLEVLVVERKNKPVALIFPDADYMKKHGISQNHLPAKIKETIKDANHHLAAYMKVADFEIMTAEFEKTPKKSIKRFKYQ
ncbi:MAG: hypothetical protein A2W93_03950 [Bacteroidetes bacterium GWF2_43_63]|nr:MAG: hypothetical protein A2W93_03950 [Bacteroidetes bacterium GWF2_43_63]HCB61750.1 long-chain fatty acid--CoA ligase [Bacteroidales bacterium]HCY22654.1 long-chain fatty acid--CoA ligase [Bacteroidales bacterium]